MCIHADKNSQAHDALKVLLPCFFSLLLLSVLLLSVVVVVVVVVDVVVVVAFRCVRVAVCCLFLL